MRWRRRTCLLAVFVLLTACSGDGAVTQESSAGHSAAATSPRPTNPATGGLNLRPGDKPPVLTAGAKTHTAAAAKAFATYFVQAVDWGLATTDAYLISAISAPSCRTCAGYIQSLTARRTRGDSVHGARIQVVSATIMRGTLPVKADYGVELLIREDAPVAASAGSAAPSTDTRANQDYARVYLDWTAGGWQVVEETER
jgi:Family of unknown function (DUF6318)